jgi:sterol desaturase/sphingolipid hydroxylase (fatty acid hydroxylase superfamily)
MDSSFILLLIAPVFVAFVIFEMIYYRKTNKYSIKDTIANIALSLMFQGSDILFTIFIVKTVYTWIFLHGFKWFATNNTLNLIILFIAQDFMYYWFHRASHRIRFGWCSHVTHHSSTYLNFSTSFRQSLMYPISGMWLFWLPLAFIGFNPETVIAVVAINLAFQFFVHTQMLNKFTGKLAFIEQIFNTPSHHRAHHATNPEYIDKNYAGLLIIWDRLFGTFEPENAIPSYGLVHQIDTHNPLIITFHEWIAMVKDLIRDKDLRYLWLSPEKAENLRQSYTSKKC